MPENAAIGILAQLIVTQRIQPDRRSTVLSVYDSDPEVERSPHTFALVLPSRLTVKRLIEWLQLDADCHPPDSRNQCSLWFGRMPIAESLVVNVQMGHAFRLLVTRGAPISIAQLLTLDHSQLRDTLQRSMNQEIFVRPPDPQFLQSETATFPAVLPDADMSPRARPEWIRVLQRHFDFHHTIEDLQEGAILYCQSWYVNAHPDFHCSQPRRTKIQIDPLMWRTDVLFPWRDRLVRALPPDIHVLQAPLGGSEHPSPEVQILIAQGLPTDNCAVIITLFGSNILQLQTRRFAHVFQCRVAVRDILRLAVPNEHAHRPSLVQYNGRTYLVGEHLLLQMGGHLGVLIEEHEIDFFTEQLADSFSLYQQTAISTSRPVQCKPAPFGEPDDFAVSLPAAHAPRPGRPRHDGEVEWSLQLGEIFQQFGELDVWDDTRTMEVTTWYLHHGLRPICRRSRRVRLAGHVITWIEDLRQVWSDLMDRHVPFSIRVVHPRPPQFRVERAQCHLLLEQGRVPNSAGIILTALFDGHPNAGILQGAYSVNTRINLQSIISTMEISHVCEGRTCSVVTGRQDCLPHDEIEVHSGQSLRIMVTQYESNSVDQEVADLRFEDLSLMQTSGGCFQFDPNAPIFVPSLPSIGTQPEWLQDMQRLWDTAAFSWEGEARAATFLTWFVSPGTGQGRCLYSRRSTLYNDFTQWERILRALWVDILDHTASIEFVLVLPMPEQIEPAIAGHLILIQHPIEDMSSPLVTVTDAAIHQGHPFRMVVTVNERAYPRDVLQSVGYDRDCYLQGAQCNLRVGPLQWAEGTPMPARDGDCIYLLVARPFLPPDWVPPFMPVPPYTEGINLLQTATKVLKQTKSEPAGSRVHLIAWYLDATHRTSRQMRHLVLREEQSLAKAAEQLWADVLQKHPCHVFAVETMRRCLETDDGLDEVVFLVVRDLPLEFAAILLEGILDTGFVKETEHVAALVPSDTPFDVLWSQLHGKASSPNFEAMEIFVQGRVCDAATWPDLPHGTCVSFWMHQQWLAAMHTRIDFVEVFRTMDWLDTHFFLPQYDLPHHFPFLPESLDWLQDWWDPSLGGNCVRIYFDGSFVSSATKSTAGAAVAAFVQVDGVWKFAGALSTQLPDSYTSYTSEIAASIIASKFAFDILKLCQIHPKLQVSDLTFCYDSLTAGKQTSGQWNVFSEPKLGRFLRGLQKCIETKFQIDIQYRHIKAHRGEPGNELVDTLAFQAALGEPLHALTDWLSSVTKTGFVDMLEWCWYLYRPDMRWDGQFLCLPAAPATVPVPETVAANDHSDHDTHLSSGELSIKVATCNVLSLLPGQVKPTSENGPARQDCLLQQFEDSQVHIFALQETRIKRLSNAHDSRFWLYKASATAHGHYGIMIGLTRLRPIGTVQLGAKKQDVYIGRDDVAIVATNPRFLILRVKTILFHAILIAGHAPHSGTDAAEVADWWKQLAKAVPDKYAFWPRILLADANARVGSEPCPHVGPHQAEKGNGKEEGFLQFVRTQGLFLPSTFAACHSGEGGTWLHNNGNWCRNDFVGLPIEWHYDSCHSWVSTSIDAGLTKEDHRALVVHVGRTVQVRPSGVQQHKNSKLHLAAFDDLQIEPVTPYAWNLDVHTHAHTLQKDLTDQLWHVRTKTPKQPLKTTMSAETWQLVCQKRDARHALGQFRRMQHGTLLAAWFACWQHAMVEVESQELITAYDDLLSQHDRLIAVAYQHFRCMGRQVVKALRRDDVSFYDSLLRDGAAFLGPHETKRLWKVVRRSLPKFQQRRMTAPPFQIEGLEDQWLPHFGILDNLRLAL